MKNVWSVTTQPEALPAGNIWLAGRDSKVDWKSVIMFEKKLELLKPIWNEKEGEKTTGISFFN